MLWGMYSHKAIVSDPCPSAADPMVGHECMPLSCTCRAPGEKLPDFVSGRVVQMKRVEAGFEVGMASQATRDHGVQQLPWEY
jgi:hypothetical protein